MPAKTLAASLCLLMLPATTLAAGEDIAQLQAEIAALKARNAILEQACPAAASAAPDSSAPGEASVPVFAAAAPPAPAAPLPPPPAQAMPVPSAPPVPAAPPAATAAPAQTIASAKRYDNTGCDRGIFSGPPPGKWRNAKSWNGLGKGMGMADVEALLGVEHYDSEKREGVQWQYGRCGSSWEGSVTFVDGRVVSFSPPENQ